MINVPGNLSVRTINGRNGAFNVGRLSTDIGEFAVKDALLEEYDEGRYEGRFTISRIYGSHYIASGRIVIEIRATLADITLSSFGDLPEEQAVPDEPDPVDEAPTLTAEQMSLEPADDVPQGDAPTEPADSDPADEDTDAAAAELFGHLWPLGDQVKLDPTIGDRIQFRRQRDWLKDHGYKFQLNGQVWNRS